MQRPFIFFLMLLPGWCFPQPATFQEVLSFNASSTEAAEIIAANDGGYVFAGTTNIGGNAESFLAKYNASGGSEWTKIYYDQQSHQLYSGVDDTEIFCNQYVRFLVSFHDGFVVGGGIDSSVFITYSNGVTVGYDYTRLFAIYTDASGNVIWSKKFNANDNTFGEAAMATSDGSLLLAGSVTQPGFVLRDIALWKLKEDGTTYWAQSYGGSFDEGVAKVIEASPSQWMVCGTSESFSNNQNIYLLSIDSAGQLNWSNTYGTSGFDYGKGLVKSNDGYYLFGNAGNGNPSYIALIKTDTGGVMQWANTYGNFLFDSPRDLFNVPDGNLVFLADHAVFTHDALACEVNPEGGLVDAHIYGNPTSGNDFITGLLPTPNGYLLTGTSNSFGGSQFFNQAYLVQTHAGLASECYSETLAYNPTPLTLTTAAAATSVSVLAPAGYPMMTTVLDSSLITDTLCFSIATGIPGNPIPGFRLFPNPSDDYVTLDGNATLLQVRCFNTDGILVFSKNTNGRREIQLPTAGLPEGIYLLEIKTLSGDFYQKMVVSH